MVSILIRVYTYTEDSDRGYSYHCSICNISMVNLKAVLDHRKLVHNSTKSKVKHLDLEPNIDNPNHYCKACEFVCKSKNTYRGHLQKVHHMILTALKRRRPSKGRLRNNIMPDPEDPKCYCLSCQRTYPNRSLYRVHLRKFHGLRLKRPKFIINPDITPNWNDPDFHCASCNRTYKSKKTYKEHCTKAHHMKSPANRRGIEQVDLGDGSTYCKVCQLNFKGKKQYRAHCRYKHGAALVKSVKPQAVPDMNDPTNYCKLCGKRFGSTLQLRRHLFALHNMINTIPVSKQCDKQPDMNHPKKYCCCCDKTLASRQGFRMHLLGVHALTQTGQRKDVLEPVVDDANCYCRVCKQSYTSRSTYCKHLRYVHQAILKPLWPQGNFTSLPDPDDPKLHCSVCNITKKSARQYRGHCRSIHHMILRPSGIKNPNAIIDLNSANIYCAQCEHHYSNKYYFRLHLERIHKTSH